MLSSPPAKDTAHGVTGNTHSRGHCTQVHAHTCAQGGAQAQGHTRTPTDVPTVDAYAHSCVAHAYTFVGAHEGGYVWADMRIMRLFKAALPPPSLNIVSVTLPPPQQWQLSVPADLRGGSWNKEAT